ncbi:prepilin peptidase [Cupriavidus sp. WGtm5]|uniref:A24 family peptidase n=1 Tax=Cupriavidus sp. WGtm5 TaxID=2919926 RepID=UPI002090A321|nr:prepilin peptidase [Cupriavidus sp. WGtm5]MCO4891726.1 prepilin peptidase [Cupriavidus sp. WGtm5]
MSTISPYIGPLTIVIVLTAAAIDLQRRRIPNWLTFGAWALAIPAQIAMHGFGHGFLTWSLGWLTGLAVLLPLYLLRGMAAGDVKLMAAVGAWLGAAMAFEIALVAFLVGGLWALALVFWFRSGGLVLRNVWGIVRARPNGQSVGSLPYGVAIAAGTLVVLFASK